MFKHLLCAATFALIAPMAHAEAYSCEIESYSNPTNFSGSRALQKEALISWMPFPTFYVETNGETAVMHHSGGTSIDSKSASIDGNTLVYTFRDYPVGFNNRTRHRDNIFVYDTENGSFYITLRMNNGSSVRNSGGTARGHCTVN